MPCKLALALICKLEIPPQITDHIFPQTQQSSNNVSPVWIRILASV